MFKLSIARLLAAGVFTLAVITGVTLAAGTLSAGNFVPQEGTCLIEVTRNPGGDPAGYGPTGMLEIFFGTQTDAQIQTGIHGPMPSNFPDDVEVPMMTGQTMLNTDSGQVNVNGSGQYFFPATFDLQGQVEFLTGTREVKGFQGVLRVRGIEGPPPDIDFGLECVFQRATPTPPSDQIFSITVLKLNSATHRPIGGWLMELFANDDCSGDPIADARTDDDGLIDFANLAEGVYSVREDMGLGFTPDDDVCQKVLVGGAATAGNGLPDCPIQPDSPFPAAGCDRFDSGAQVNVEIIGADAAFTVTLNGPVLIERKNAPADTNSNGLDDVQTEIVAMELTGPSSAGPIAVHQSSQMPSLGQFEEQEDLGAAVLGQANGVMDFPAVSYFDIFVEIETSVGVLHNEDPIRMECIILEIPPLFCLYQPPIDDPIELFNESDVVVALLVHAAHVPLPLGEVLIVFNNSPVQLWGDWNCDGEITIVDGLALLRIIAFLSALGQQEPCADIGEEFGLFIFGDVDCNGVINAVDVLAILRLIVGLPVPPPPIGPDCYTLGEPVEI